MVLVQLGCNHGDIDHQKQTNHNSQPYSWTKQKYIYLGSRICMNAWPRRALYQIRWQLKEKSKAPEQLTSEEQGGDIVVIVLPPRVLDECGFVCELFVNAILFENYLIVCELYIYNNLCSIVCSTFHFVFWRMQIVFGICQVFFYQMCDSIWA